MSDWIKILILQIEDEKLSSHPIEAGCDDVLYLTSHFLGKSNKKLKNLCVVNTPLQQNGTLSMVTTTYKKILRSPNLKEQRCINLIYPHLTCLLVLMTECKRSQHPLSRLRF